MPNVTETVAQSSKFALAGQFFDWFCTDASLPRRAEALQKRLAQIAALPKIDASLDVIFKNNQPMGGPTYDDFRLVEPVSRDVVWCVVPRGSDGKAEVWGRENKFQGPLVEGAWRDVIAFFSGPPVEICGVRGLQGKPFRKSFPSQVALEAWLAKNGGDVTIHASREAEAV